MTIFTFTLLGAIEGAARRAHRLLRWFQNGVRAAQAVRWSIALACVACSVAHAQPNADLEQPLTADEMSVVMAEIRRMWQTKEVDVNNFIPKEGTEPLIRRFLNSPKAIEFSGLNELDRQNAVILAG